MDLTKELAAVVLTLRDPTVNLELQLKQLVWALPLAKNPSNIQLLIAQLGPRFVASPEAAAMLADALAAASQRKRRITSPTVPWSEWVALVVHTASGLPALVGLAVAAGLGAEPDAVDLVVRATDQITYHSRSELEIDGTVAVLSKAQWHLPSTAAAALPAARLIKPALRIVYGPQALLSLSKGSLPRDFGAYSRLIALLLQHLDSAADIEWYLDVCSVYVRHAIAQSDINLIRPISGVNTPEQSDNTDNLKALLFGVCIQLEGIASQLLLRRTFLGSLGTRLAVRMLVLLQPLGVIIETTGIFDALAFVRSVSVDILIGKTNMSAKNGADMAAMALMEPFQWGHASSGPLLFMLETCELLVPALSERVRTEVLETTRRFLTPPPLQSSSELDRAVFEAAHSLTLVLLALGGPNGGRDEMAFKYLSTVLPLFPQLLSWRQLNAALDGITASLGIHPHRQHVLWELFERAKAEIPGLPLPSSSSLSEGEPPTTRAALVGCLIHALPKLCAPRNFALWLERVEAMIPQPYNVVVSDERRWIVSELTATLGNLDLSLADVGIRWWFSQRL